MTGPEHTYTQMPWSTQWAMDLWSHTGAAVILRDQAEDPYCTGTTIYPNSPPNWTWSKIAERTPILIIAPTREDWYQDQT